jgi:lipase maturation factor 1
MDSGAENVERAASRLALPASLLHRFFTSQPGASGRLLPRWIFLRALGLIYFSAFYSLAFQIRGLIGPQGILPADEYLKMFAASSLGLLRYWYAPSLLWISSGSPMLMGLCWAGMFAALLVVFNLWPRGMLVVCFVCYLSFTAAARDFSGYQSDSMLLEAGFLALFFAPGGLRPGLGRQSPPSLVSYFLLQWEWFRIYFESGLVKLVSGDPQWRNFTAMDEYYQNCPLPTWIGWYVQHLPHWFQAASVGATLLMELVLVWMAWLPRRIRIALFFFVTLWQAGVILTANYTFLNYLVLSLGILLVDDHFLQNVWRLWKSPAAIRSSGVSQTEQPAQPMAETAEAAGPRSTLLRSTLLRSYDAFKLAIVVVMLVWVFYASTARLIWILAPHVPLPEAPVAALEPFRIADQYGLFAVMTRQLYQIEFQGSDDGKNWTAYPFRYKPQALDRPPKIYAPYQPRLDWNLWFASLGSWREYPFVVNTEIRLLTGDRDVLSLFAGNPFPHAPPTEIRAVLWQYWFTTMSEKRATGNWWRRQSLGLYAPTLELQPDSNLRVVEMPDEQGTNQ